MIWQQLHSLIGSYPLALRGLGMTAVLSLISLALGTLIGFALGVLRAGDSRTQAMRVVLPPLVGQYVLLIKDSSVVSAIGLTDLTRVGWLVVQRVPNGLLVFALVGLAYFIVCYPLILLASRLEKRLGAAHAEVQL